MRGPWSVWLLLLPPPAAELSGAEIGECALFLSRAVEAARLRPGLTGLRLRACPPRNDVPTSARRRSTARMRTRRLTESTVTVSLSSLQTVLAEAPAQVVR